MPIKNSSIKQQLTGGISPKKKIKETKEEKIEHLEKTKIEPTQSPLEAEENDIYEEPIRQVVIPVNQLHLTEDQLKEEFTRVLTANDPNLPINITKYNYKERVYKIDPPGPDDHVYIHTCIDGTALHKESEDAKAQIAYEVKKYEEEKEARELFIRQSAEEAENKGEKLDESTLEQFDMNQKNQFNYSERAAQTFTQPVRSRLVTTEPPPVVSYMGTFTQWEIYDAYMNFYEQNQKEQIQKLAIAHKKEKEQGAAAGGGGAGGTAAGSGTNASSVTTGISNPSSDLKGDPSSSGISVAGGRSKEEDMVHSTAMSKSLKILERMVNQNAEDEIFQDFKYWEDISDEYREGEGSLLPLWRFSCERVKKKTVTCVSWNTVFHDLFAVGYGSYDFLKQGSGIICCYTLKNTSHPEYIVALDSGVMSLDFHPQYPVLLAVGCYDGTVMVYDIRNKINKPVYQSTIKTGKHNDPVWQVHWQEEDLTKELNFYSISSDGKVANWITSKNELKMELVMQLKLVNLPITISEISNNAADGNAASENTSAVNIVNDNEETSLSGLASGCCFDFNKTSDHLFLVGTEEGKIHKCSKAYSGQYLETYLGHNMAVYTIKWNTFHPRVFLSCSADWTVKLWDHNNSEPILSFDLGNAVNDIAWSTVSSTVFAAVTSDGKVHVFDLLENKNEPICEQKIVKKAKLTRIVFNKSDPIILVGDDHGGVNCLKLSPNLRKIAKATDRMGTENGTSSNNTTGASNTVGTSGSGNAVTTTGGAIGNLNAPASASNAAGGATSAPTSSGDAEVSTIILKPNVEVEIDKMEKLLSATDNSRISGNNKGGANAMTKKKKITSPTEDSNEANSRSLNL